MWVLLQTTPSQSAPDTAAPQQKSNLLLTSGAKITGNVYYRMVAFTQSTDRICDVRHCPTGTHENIITSSCLLRLK